MNLVYVKFELAKPAPGKILKIIIDDGAPVENDSRSLESRGTASCGGNGSGKAPGRCSSGG
jgi:TusA-related sulfurtransferase